MIGNAITYLESFAVFAKDNYQVDPLIFTVLFFGSAIPLYYGYYMIGRSAITFQDKKFKRKKLDRRELRKGVVISVIAWWVPYWYVMIFGRLPFKMWIIFLIFLSLFGAFFVKILKTKIREAKQKAGEDDS